jgi:hypothetical protein
MRNMQSPAANAWTKRGWLSVICRVGATHRKLLNIGELHPSYDAADVAIRGVARH